ncbi:MAG TPA: adenosylcobinamide-GDP ribazoletransferase [Thermoanaerobaculia bacterium]|jgi:adenosylcobinamide-GDP ribazoletransferase
MNERRSPGRWIGEQARLFFTAVMFMTRLPVPRWVGFQPEWLPRSTVYFPWVGVVVGLIAAGVYGLAAMAWPQPLPAVLALAAGVCVTGAFHEDGLADTFDGIGGGTDRERVLAIMADSRIGSYGMVALVLVIACKLAALSVLSTTTDWAVPRALVAAHVLARWSSLPLLWHYPYVRRTGGTGKPFAAGVDRFRLAVGTAAALAIAAAALGWRAVPAVAAAGLATMLAGRDFRRRLGGITGDCLGAANQLVELAVYLVLAARLPSFLPMAFR